MSYTAILNPRARKELLKAWVWYEKKMFGLGDRFENEVYNRIKQIERTPERYPKKRSNFRETKIKTFPYLIIYRIDEERNILIVSSVFHTSRNPRLKYKKD